MFLRNKYVTVDCKTVPTLLLTSLNNYSTKKLTVMKNIPDKMLCTPYILWVHRMEKELEMP